MRLIEDAFVPGRVRGHFSAISIILVANVVAVFLPLAPSIEASIVKRAPQVTAVGETTVQLMLSAVRFDDIPITAYYVLVARKADSVPMGLRLLNSTDAEAAGLGYYVTARFAVNEITGRQHFIVGTGDVVGGFINVPLQTGTLYKFGWVAETRLLGESSFDYRITAFSIAPTAPGYFQKRSVAGETVITWNKTHHNGGWTQVAFAPIAYAQPECYLENGEPRERILWSKTRQVFLRKLRAHSYYFVSISAVPIGKGTTRSFVFQTAEEVPSGRPGNLTHSMSPEAYDVLTWSEVPCDQLNGANVSYFVELTSNDTWEADKRGSDVNGTREVYRDLMPFTMYQARVFAQNNVGRSPQFASIVFTTPPAPPPEPTDLLTFWLTTSSVLVSWNAPYPPHGVLDHYELKFWNQADPEMVSRMNFSPEECQRKRALVPRHCITVKELDANISYRFSVRAVNKGGLFSPFLVQRDIDERRTAGRLKNVHSSERGQHSLKIHWSASDFRKERPAGYMVNTSLVHTFNRKLAISEKPRSHVVNGSHVQEIQLSHLYPASTYLVCVQAITRIFPSEPSCANFSTRASGPIIDVPPTAEALNETTVNVSFNPVDSDGGPVTAYYLLVVQKVHEVVAPIKIANFSASAATGLAYYVAARFTPDELSGSSHFIVGTGGVNGEFENPPLEAGTQYSFGWVAETNFSGETLYGYRLTPPIIVGKDVLKREAIVSSIQPDLDYLLDGNTANLPQNGGPYWGKWEDGLMPEDCKSIAEGQDLNPADFEVYDVFYDDCQDAWSVCRHKDSSEDLETLVNTFGRVPVRMRSWVRHVLSIPGSNWAFNSNGNIALSGTTTSNLDVCLHETGHSLDLLGAYVDGALSSTQEWEDAYNKDSAVPDNYARTNQVENVAQNTVVGIYDKVVPGGFPGVQSDYQKIQNQYTLLQDKAGEQILPGGTCDRHLENSATVSISGSSKRDTKVVKAREAAHDPAFKGTYTNIVKEFTPFNTQDFHEQH